MSTALLKYLWIAIWDKLWWVEELVLQLRAALKILLGSQGSLATVTTRVVTYSAPRIVRGKQS